MWIYIKKRVAPVKFRKEDKVPEGGNQRVRNNRKGGRLETGNNIHAKKTKEIAILPREGRRGEKPQGLNKHAYEKRSPWSRDAESTKHEGGAPLKESGSLHSGTGERNHKKL